MIRGSKRWVGLALVVGLTACAEREVEPPGQIVFERHCAACHGLDGKGGGPLAEEGHPGLRRRGDSHGA